MNWSIKRVDGGLVECPETWTTARVVMAEPSNLSERHVEDFACTDGRGYTPELQPDTYTSWIEFLDLDDHIMATSFQRKVAASSDRPDAHTVYIDGGYVALSWSWDRNSGACDSFLDSVQMWLSDGETAYLDVFRCQNGGGLSRPLPAGTYSVSVGQGIFDRQRLPDVTVEAPHRITTIPVVAL